MFRITYDNMYYYLLNSTFMLKDTSPLSLLEDPDTTGSSDNSLGLVLKNSSGYLDFNFTQYLLGSANVALTQSSLMNRSAYDYTILHKGISTLRNKISIPLTSDEKKRLLTLFYYDIGQIYEHRALYADHCYAIGGNTINCVTEAYMLSFSVDLSFFTEKDNIEVINVDLTREACDIITLLNSVTSETDSISGYIKVPYKNVQLVHKGIDTSLTFSDKIKNLIFDDDKLLHFVIACVLRKYAESGCLLRIDPNINLQYLREQSYIS